MPQDHPSYENFMLKQFNFPSSLAAGNVTVTNLSFTLDYSNKTNPPVQLTMPLDGMKISGDSFTLRGQVDDPTVTVTASITDTNGDVSVVNGEVERNGRFWVEDLPLNSGTNTLSITVSNVVGQATVTNLNLVQSSLILTMTPVSDPSQLWQPTVSAGGSVSDPSYAVWVNGVQGTNIGGTWSADNVPVTPGGVAVFDVTAYPPGEAPAGSFSGESVVNPQTANAANSITNGADKPARLYLQSYQMTVNSMAHEEDDDSNGSSNYYTSTLYNHIDWNATNGGGDKWQGTMDQGGSWTWHDFWEQTDKWPAAGAGTYDYFSIENGVTNVYSDYSYPPVLPSDLNPNEHMIIKGHSDVTRAGDSYTYHGHAEDNETADAQWTLETGGKSLSQRQNLFKLSATAEAFKLASVTPGNDGNSPVSLSIPDLGPVDPTTIKVDGMTLGSDGVRWRTYADNDTRNVTPRVKNNDYYTFNVSQQKYELVISANYTPLDPDVVVDGATNFWVGQEIPFGAGFSPSLPEAPVVNPVKWVFDGNYRNDESNSVPGETYPTCSIDYFVNPDKLANPATTAWWVAGNNSQQLVSKLKASFAEGLTFANGQYVIATGTGLFDMIRPQATISTGTTSVGVNYKAGYLSLIFASPFAWGIKFYNTITPSELLGSTQWIQVVNQSDRELMDIHSTNHVWTRNGSAPYGDDPIPYGPQAFENGVPVDGPGLQLLDSRYTRAVASGSYTMWMMFQPPGSGHLVPLNSVSWSWSGSATNGVDGWGLEKGTNTLNPKGADTQTYPQWKSLSTDAQWQPPLLP
jgi:hypothetical protein